MLAERLLSSRREANFDQKELAQRSKISISYISDIERKKVTDVGIETIEALANALGVAPSWLAGWSDVNTPTL